MIHIRPKKWGILENRKGAGEPAASGSGKSGEERAGELRIKACRQAFMILQHDNSLICATEFGFHEGFHTRFPPGRQETLESLQTDAKTEKAARRPPFPQE
ncbi:hypothetical protein NOF55_19545 [Rhizobiaceae bacterium BDR2-2]|uniref:Uncharacterized protein n=1 Tax=Ectorhizobium quercum TaxID=2965071 RepID=A0AAE3N1M0_9HYPH|nr:hypothetical protein [Ectorhizobium quercum]MCX8999303.1 hypothetical protein [Ectorhizobium quercum]